MVRMIDVQRFFLCGRLIFGPDVRSLLVTVFLIVAPSTCFCIFVGRHLLHHFSGGGGVAIIAVTAVYTAYVSTKSFLCMVLKRNLSCEYYGTCVGYLCVLTLRSSLNFVALVCPKLSYC